MPNQKISELTAIVTVDNSVDLLPIVDTSANTTKKITPTALKSALALDNVNNTSDANKPVSTAQQDALNAKVTANAAIVAATKTKITYDAKGLVTAGDILDAADMPTGINAANIGTGVVSSTEFGYLDGVTSAIQTQIDGKQATLVSGTNIKTINSTSLLGSGDITISANPSGVAGAIQFSNGSAFASDAANLFWDDTNNRLGVGTNAPTQALEIGGGNNIKLNTNGSLYLNDVRYATNNSSIYVGDINATGTPIYLLPQGGGVNGSIRLGGGQLALFKGSGSTSATTSLLVQNSSGTQLLKVADDGVGTLGKATINGGYNAGLVSGGRNISITGDYGDTYCYMFSGAGLQGLISDQNMTFAPGNSRLMTLSGAGAVIGSNTILASAFLQVDSTTKGFLPPRMTTTQKNAIATPAAGLVVYDSTTNKLCCYNGSTWNDLF